METFSDLATCKACEKFRGLGLHHPARTPMPVALRSNPLGLSHPARTPPPQELRLDSRLPTSGVRRVGGTKSPYAVRSERKGADTLRLAEKDAWKREIELLRQVEESLSERLAARAMRQEVRP